MSLAPYCIPAIAVPDEVTSLHGENVMDLIRKSESFAVHHSISHHPGCDIAGLGQNKFAQLQLDFCEVELAQKVPGHFVGQSFDQLRRSPGDKPL